MRSNYRKNAPSCLCNWGRFVGSEPGRAQSINCFQWASDTIRIPVLSWASKQREGGRATGKLLYPTGTEWQHFKWTKSEPVVIALSREELMKLQALDLSASPAMDNARALFLIGCYTG